MTTLVSNPFPFEVLVDNDIPHRIGMELEVYGYAAPTQKKDVLPWRTAPSFLEEMSAGGNSPVGGGSFQIQINDPKLVEDPTLLDYRNIVKCRVDGQIVSAFLIQSKINDSVNQDEAAGAQWTVSGEGLRTWFHDATVDPFGGLKKDSQTTRVFSFASPQGTWYDPTQWVTPVKLQQKLLIPDSTKTWNTAPADWPDAPTAWWIWGVANSTASPAPQGVNYFRYEFDTIGPSTDSYSVFAAGDDDMDVYVDGAQVITTRELNAYSKTWRADFTLPAGHHVLAIRVQNNKGAAGLIAALYKAGLATAGTAAVQICVTGDAGWKVNSYPATAPGWTPGEVMNTLLNEASDRGVLFPQILVPTFTDLLDSDGVAWPHSLDWEFDIGTEYTDVVAKLEELVCDVWIDPSNYELNMYIARGTNRDVQSAAVQPVKFEVGRNVVKAHSEGKSDIKNALTMATNDGFATIASSGPSISTYGRIEGMVSTGASAAVSADVATAVFDQKALPETSATYTIIDVDDARPFVDFFVGDWVLAPDETGALVPRRVMSITVTEDTKSGETQFALEFDTIFMARADRFERWLKTTGDGTLGGTLANVSLNGGSGSGTPGAQTTPSGPQGITGDPGIPGANWRGSWTNVTAYLFRDAVLYNGASWVATVNNTNTIPDGVNPQWQLIAAKGATGVTWRGNWSSATAYSQFDATFFANTSWIANNANTNSLPTTTNTDWSVLAQGAGPIFRGAWSNSTSYLPNDVVFYSGRLWISSTAHSNKTPGVDSDWSAYGGTGTRLTTVFTTSSLAAGAAATGTIPMSTGYRLYKIQTSKPSRVRLYASAAYQGSDTGRAIGTDPTGDHGLMFEYVSTSAVLTAVLSPFVDGASFESSTSIPISVTNTDLTSGAVTVTLTFMITE